MALLMFLLLTGQSLRDIDLNIPAAHPAEAFETIISVGIGSISNAFAIDADGVMWDMAIHGDGDWREQTAPQADAVWCPYTARADPATPFHPRVAGLSVGSATHPASRKMQSKKGRSSFS